MEGERLHFGSDLAATHLRTYSRWHCDYPECLLKAF